MIEEGQRLAIKNLIETENLKEFREIFTYVKRKHFHLATGITYGRLLRSIERPKNLSYEDAYLIAGVFDVQPMQISRLIHNQIDNAKLIPPMKKKK